MSQTSTKVKFSVVSWAVWSDVIYVSGNTRELGDWEPNKSIPLSTTDKTFPNWESPIIQINMVGRSQPLEYKYLIKQDADLMCWEEGLEISGNRFIPLEMLSSLRLIIMEDGHIGEKMSDPKLMSEKKEWGKQQTVVDKKDLEKYYEHGYEAYSNDVVRFIRDGDKNAENEPKKLTLLAQVSNKFGAKLKDDDLAAMAAYLSHVRNREIMVEETEEYSGEGPGQYPRTVAKIAGTMENLKNNENQFLVRCIWKNLFPFLNKKEANYGFMARIKKIAGRKEMEGEMREEIENKLINRLQCGAGPDELKNAGNIYVNILKGDYSDASKEDYGKFMEELRDYLNGGTMEEELLKLREHEKKKAPGMYGLEKPINGLLFSKLTKAESDPEHTMRSLDVLRTKIMTETMPKMEERKDYTGYDLAYESELHMEYYLYLLISTYLENTYGNESLPKNQEELKDLLQLLILVLKHIALSGFLPQEAKYISNQTRHFLGEVNKKVADQFSYMRLRATVDRLDRYLAKFAAMISKCEAKVFALGLELKVRYASSMGFLEGLIHNQLINELSTIAEKLGNFTKMQLKLTMFTMHHGGEAFGTLVRISCISELKRVVKDAKPKSVVAFVDSVCGFEEIPEELAGLVIAHELPKLSYLAIQSKVEDIPLCCYHSLIEYSLELSKHRQMELVKLLVEPTGLLIRACKLSPNASKLRDITPELYPYLEDIKGKLPVTTGDVDLSTKLILLGEKTATSKNVGDKAASSLKLFKHSENKGFKVGECRAIPFKVFDGLKSSGIIGKLMEDVDRTPMDGLSNESDPLLSLSKEVSKCLDGPTGETMINDLVKAIRAQFKANNLYLFGSPNVHEVEETGLILEQTVKVSKGDELELKRGIKRIWLSLYDRHSILRRVQMGIPEKMAHMAVLIQEYIPCELTFILNSKCPRSKNPKEMAIEIMLGEKTGSPLQEGIPYTLIYDRTSKKVSILDLASISFQTGGLSVTEPQNVRIDYSDVSHSLTPSDLIPTVTKITEICFKLEEMLKGDIMVKGGISGKEVYLFHIRPQIVH